MSKQTGKLGGRLPLLDPHELSGAQKELYDRENTTMVPWAESAGFRSKTDDGKLIGPFNPVLFSPDIGRAFLDLQAAEQGHTTLSKRVREVVILSVGAVWRSDYEVYAHMAVGRSVGLSDEAVRMLAGGELPSDLTEPERIAQRYTAQLCRDHRVSTELYHAAEKAFGQQGLVDIAFLAGIYQLVCTLLNGFEIPVPE
jgi:4-carboxymuconolactone decarboxylase